MLGYSKYGLWILGALWAMWLISLAPNAMHTPLHVLAGLLFAFLVIRKGIRDTKKTHHRRN